jgi:ABC-2 type transport system ATP-binding protein
MAVVRTSGLTKRFGRIAAVQELDLELPSGGVIGLVGPNGSGKSTLIRMLLGLVTPTAGEAWVLGEPVVGPRRYLARVGALVEGPAFVPGLSARANLRSLARLRGLPDARVAEVLRTVGLAGREREPVARYSLGMKQRLGIAAALLPEPELLVLDEPTNGLDPAGIVEIRALLRSLGAAGRTVLVSSHLLAEIEEVCDALVVVRFGRLVHSGPMWELLARSEQHLDVRPERPVDLGGLAEVLAGAGWPVTRAGAGLRVGAGAEDAAAVNRAAAQAGITLSALVPARDGLEQLFLEMTGADGAELSAARAATAAEVA